MTDRENDFNRTAQDGEGRQVQQELERQLRELGDTMSDSFRHGFEGRGEEIGDRVWDVGRAAVNAAGYGISEAGRAFQAGKQEYQKRAEEARSSASASGMTDWARNFFAKKPEPTAIENIRTSAKKRHSAGVAMLATGITFAVIFGITAIACFGTAGAFTSGGVIVAADMTVLSAIGDLALGAIAVTGWCSAAVTAVFGWLTAAGASRMKAAKTLELYADTAEGFDWHKGLSLSMLADLTHKKKTKALKVLRSRLLAQKQAEHDSKIAAERRSQVGTGDRSERIRTYNYPQGRLTDHRIGLTLYKLDTILNGVLDEVVDALVTADQAEKLKASTEE